MNKIKLKKEFKYNFQELRKIINSLNLIPNSPLDEFDSLNHQILSHLYKDSDFKQITTFLHNELNDYYGLSVNLKDIEIITIEIINWWNSKS